MKRNDSLENLLDATFQRIDKVDFSELELRADFSRYLCVLVSGYLEQSIRNASADFARARASPAIANFVVKGTSRLMNLSSNKLKEHLLAFDAQWETQLNALLSDETKDAVDSVVALRHGIAHGQAADVTFERISRYYKEVKRVVAEIRALMKLDP